VANVILVRHGETALNKKASGGAESAERIRGHVDVPLDAKGKKESAALGVEFANSGVVRVYTSDLSRARVPALAIARAAHVPVIPTEKLRPWNLGILQGKEVKKVLPVMNKCIEHPETVIPDGESFNDFRLRYLPFLDARLKEASSSAGPIIVVTHSRNVQLARAWDKAGRPKNYSFDLDRMNDYRDEIPPSGHMIMKP
jgi:broad specificity phosphatase PhoE